MIVCDLSKKYKDFFVCLRWVGGCFLMLSVSCFVFWHWTVLFLGSFLMLSARTLFCQARLGQILPHGFEATTLAKRPMLFCKMDYNLLQLNNCFWKFLVCFLVGLRFKSMTSPVWDKLFTMFRLFLFGFKEPTSRNSTAEGCGPESVQKVKRTLLQSLGIDQSREGCI